VKPRLKEKRVAGEKMDQSFREGDASLNIMMIITSMSVHQFILQLICGTLAKDTNIL